MTNTNQPPGRSTRWIAASDRVEVGDVHERELAGRPVERAGVERGEALGVVQHVGGFASRRHGVSSGEIEHRTGRIRAGDLPRSCSGDGSGGEPLPARDVEHGRIREVGRRSRRQSTAVMCGPLPDRTSSSYQPAMSDQVGPSTVLMR